MHLTTLASKAITKKLVFCINRFRLRQKKLVVLAVFLFALGWTSHKASTGNMINSEMNIQTHESPSTILGERNRNIPNNPDEISIMTDGKNSTFNNKTVAVTRQNEGNSFSMYIYEEKDVVSNSVRTGYWEGGRVQELNDYFIKYSKKHNIPLSDLTFIDIGANVGWFSFNMAALGVNVLAFEPMKENIQLIRDSLALPDNVASGVSDRITLYPHGLGVKDEVCFMYSGDENVGNGQVKCVENESNITDVELQGRRSIRGRIPVHRLDNVVNIDDEDLRIVAIKMDTEGYESHVLEGGSKVLLEGGADAILSEFVIQFIREKDGDPVRFIKKMGDGGYHVKLDGKLLSTERMVERVESNEGFGGVDITLERRVINAPDGEA